MNDTQSGRTDGQPYEWQAAACLCGILILGSMLGVIQDKLGLAVLLVGGVVVCILVEVMAVLWFLSDPESLRGKTQEEVAPRRRMFAAYCIAVLFLFPAFLSERADIEALVLLFLIVSLAGFAWMGKYSFKLVAWKFLKWRHG